MFWCKIILVLNTLIISCPAVAGKCWVFQPLKFFYCKTGNFRKLLVKFKVLSVHEIVSILFLTEVLIILDHFIAKIMGFICRNFKMLSGFGIQGLLIKIKCSLVSVLVTFWWLSCSIKWAENCNRSCLLFQTRHQRGDTHPLTLEEILDETQHLDIGLKQKQWLMSEVRKHMFRFSLKNSDRPALCIFIKLLSM